MSDQPPLDDDTSAGRITQGGHGPRIGHSIWWVLLAAALILAGGLYFVSIHQTAPAEHGTIPAGRAAPPTTPSS